MGAGFETAVDSALFGDGVHLERKFAIGADSSLVDASWLFWEADSVRADVVVVFALVASSSLAVRGTVLVFSDTLSLENDEV